MVGFQCRHARRIAKIWMAYFNSICRLYPTPCAKNIRLVGLLSLVQAVGVNSGEKTIQGIEDSYPVRLSMNTGRQALEPSLPIMLKIVVPFSSRRMNLLLEIIPSFDDMLRINKLKIADRCLHPILFCLFGLGRRDATVVLEKGPIDVATTKRVGMMRREAFQTVKIVEEFLATLPSAFASRVNVPVVMMIPLSARPTIAPRKSRTTGEETVSLKRLH